MRRHQDRLCPPTFVPTEEQKKLAHARYVEEYYFWDMIYYLGKYFRIKEGLDKPDNIITEEHLKKECRQWLDFWDKTMDEWTDDNSIAECMMSYEAFDKQITNGLDSIHAGDCTAIPCSCWRCIAERAYNIPSTVTWNKHEGSRMYREWSDDVDKERKCE